MARGLTARQAECLAIIRESVATRGFPPTLREIGARMGIGSTNGVNDHLKALERKGAIARDDELSRGIRVLDPTAGIGSVAPPLESARIRSLREQLGEAMAQVRLIEQAIELEEQIERAAKKLARPRLEMPTVDEPQVAQ